MATLTGTNPADDRVLIISGHLDSRNSDIMDSTGKAPGANDDASGVAIVMELARIMSSREFPCSIVFVAVQGEEQGLLGAKHLASRAKNENWNVVGMITTILSAILYLMKPTCATTHRYVYSAKVYLLSKVKKWHNSVKVQVLKMIVLPGSLPDISRNRREICGPVAGRANLPQ
jgi:Zn-dependent M28 family amino/carboxypeptidase